MKVIEGEAVILDREQKDRVERFYPERMTDIRGWHGHLPFAFWIMDMLKPKVFVELGTHRGDSYCGFCQAVRELSLETRCWAVDTWKGDAHAGYYDDTIFEDLAGYHQKEYSDFSNLIRKTFDEALPLFEDASIDLLHIDGHHTYEDAKHDFFSWLPKVSGEGIALLHDIQVYGQDFGVWKLFKELSEKYPSFEFFHSNGLGVLGIGKTFQPAIQRLFALSRSEAENVRSYFRHLGVKLCRHGKAEEKGLQASLINAPPEPTPTETETKAPAAEQPEVIKKASLEKIPNISVVIPTFNHEPYVMDAVRSVLDQSEPDFELILMDDGSTDGTVSKVSATQDPRVSIFKQPHMGAAAAINRGLEMARGKYLAILNSDDMYAPNRLEVMKHYLDENPDVDMVASLVCPIDKSGALVREGTELGKWLGWYYEALGRADDDQDLARSLLINDYVVTTSNLFFKNEVFKENRPFDTNLCYCHGYKFLLDVINRHRFRLVRDFLLKYRLNDAGTVNENQFARNLEILYVIFNTVDIESVLARKNIAERMKHLLFETLKESTAYALELQGSVKDLNARLMAVNRELGEAKQQIGAFEVMINERDRLLSEVFSSRGWKWLTRFRNAKQMLDVRRLAKKQNDLGDPR